MLTYRLILPEGCDAAFFLPKLRQLEEEEPLLRVLWNESLQEISMQMMGQVQIEVLKSQMEERFGVLAEFGTGSIVYKETIAGPVEGAGHFEPLRHYAEVHLLLEPGEPGSGLSFAVCAVRTFWIKTGSVLCSLIWKRGSIQAFSQALPLPICAFY